MDKQAFFLQRMCCLEFVICFDFIRGYKQTMTFNRNILQIILNNIFFKFKSIKIGQI